MTHRLTASVLLATAVATAAAPSPAHAIRIKQSYPAEASTAFAFDAYAELAKQKGNVAFSPTSIYLALALLEEGAGGDHAEKLRTAMRLSGWRNDGALAGALGEWRKALTSSKLKMANGIWTARGVRLSKAYVRRMQKSLGAQVRSVDFAKRPEKSRKAINAWIAARTGKKIKELLPGGSIDRSTDVVLANALYFKGTWKHEFDPKATKDVDFHLDAKTSAKVPMMHRTGEARYGTTAEAEILELPYAGSSLAMDVILPADGKDLADLEKTMSTEFPRWIAALTDEEKVSISLPRFTVDQKTDLIPMFEALGLGWMLADIELSRMLVKATPHAVSGAYHQTFVAVDEKGTEAAAATAITIVRTSMPRHPVFRADRPFLWTIRDTKTGTIVFVGRIVDPRS
jgi:serpin B